MRGVGAVGGAGRQRQDVPHGFVPHFRRDTDPNISLMRHHPDVQRFLEWCKEKGLLSRYRAFLQRQAEHSRADVERLMAAIDVGMTRWKWARGGRPGAKLLAERAKKVERAKKKAPRRRTPRRPRGSSRAKRPGPSRD